MIEKRYLLSGFGRTVINLGKAGEAGATCVLVDVSEWMDKYPNAAVKLFVTPPSPHEPYFADVTIENKVVRWELWEADTTVAGNGSLELLLMDGDRLIKSVTARTTMTSSPSQEKPAGDKPQASPTWWKEALRQIEDAKQAAISEIDGTFDSEVAEGEAALAAAGAAQQSAIENKGKNTLDSIPEDYTALANDVSSLKDTKADAIRDTSAKAASHTLHAQSGPMSVTLHGKTVETGTGEKSPENPYTISGVDVAKIQAGSRNMIKFPYYDTSKTVYGVTFTVQDDGKLTAKGTATGNAVFNLGYPIFYPGTYRLSGGKTSNARFVANKYANGVDIAGSTDIGNGAVLTLDKTTPMHIYVVVMNGTTIDDTFAPQIEPGETAHAYEPYNANVIDMPLLPDGKPLMEGDTVENDVLSGCDKKIVLDGSSDELYTTLSGGRFILTHIDGAPLLDFKPAATDSAIADVFSSHAPSMSKNMMTSASRGVAIAADGTLYIKLGPTTEEDLRVYLAANPLKVYYRSTEYTPEKALRVCRVTRRLEKVNAKDLTFNSLNVAGTIFGYIRNNKLSPEATNERIWSNAYKPVPGGWAGFQSVANSFNVRGNQVGIRDDAMGGTLESAQAYFATSDAYFIYPLATPEVYMTDHHELRKPYGIMPVTVTGSGETAVEYPHQTKHYIDSQIAAAVALALNG